VFSITVFAVCSAVTFAFVIRSNNRVQTLFNVRRAATDSAQLPNVGRRMEETTINID